VTVFAVLPKRAVVRHKLTQLRFEKQPLIRPVQAAARQHFNATVIHARPTATAASAPASASPSAAAPSHFADTVALEAGGSALRPHGRFHPQPCAPAPASAFAAASASSASTAATAALLRRRRSGCRHSVAT
jgi:hypothetical protein